MTSKNGLGKCSLFFSQRSKHGLLVSCQRKPYCREGIVRLANRVAVWRQSKVLIDFRKVLGHEGFSPECLLNEPKVTRVCISSIIQLNRFNSVGVLFRVLFARFHFKVIRKSLYKEYKYIYRSCYSLKGATSRYLLSFLER